MVCTCILSRGIWLVSLCNQLVLFATLWNKMCKVLLNYCVISPKPDFFRGKIRPFDLLSKNSVLIFCNFCWIAFVLSFLEENRLLMNRPVYSTSIINQLYPPNPLLPATNSSTHFRQNKDQVPCAIFPCRRLYCWHIKACTSSAAKNKPQKPSLPAINPLTTFHQVACAMMTHHTGPLVHNTTDTSAISSRRHHHRH